MRFDLGGGGGGKRRGLGPRNDVLTTCKAVNPRASQRSSKAAECFIMNSTLALIVVQFLKNSVYFLLQQNSIIVVSVKALICFAYLIILLWERASNWTEQHIFGNVNKRSLRDCNVL